MRESRSKVQWEKRAISVIVNAFYNSRGNAMIFPAAFLQGRYFDFRAPSYFNYGGVGVAMGHEITHGFDDRGRQFDEKGGCSAHCVPAGQEHGYEHSDFFLTQAT